MPAYASAVNKTFSRLTVLEILPLAPKSRTYHAHVRCVCGNERRVQVRHILNGHTRSCGCFHRSNAKLVCARSMTTHGCTRANMRTPEYIAWDGAYQRCTNPRNPRFHDYGGRGIKFTKRWQGKGGFARFLADVGKRPFGTSLDRFPNNDGHYKKGNVRWATPKQQARNRRKRKSKQGEQ